MAGVSQGLPNTARQGLPRSSRDHIDLRTGPLRTGCSVGPPGGCLCRSARSMSSMTVQTRPQSRRREPKCADTAGTVLVPRAGHFQR